MTVKDMKYWLATPTGGQMDLEYVLSLVKTLKHLAKEGYEFPDFATGAASEIPNLHSMLETMMRATTDQQGIFWVGADHSWTPEDFCRILEATRVKPDAIIGALYPQAAAGKMVGLPLSGGFNPKEIPDLVPAEHLGWGFLWTPFSLFRKIRPPFWNWTMQTDPSSGFSVMASPDVYFCHQARQAGVEVLIHRRVVNVGHGQRMPHMTAMELQKKGKA